MTIFLFWNLNQKELSHEVVQLCKHHNVDVLILSEAAFSDVKLQKNLTKDTGNIYIAPYNELSSKLKFFFRYPSESISPVADDYGCSISQ